MSFARPDMLLWLLLLVPIVGYSLWAVARAQGRRARLFGGLAGELAPRFSRGRRLLRDSLAALALAGTLLAAAGPLFGTWVREVVQRGVDVMIVLDTSRSMLARDMSPSRLDRAKRDVRGLLEHLGGDRVGLVTFAGDARRVCPLTHDPTSFRVFLDDVDTLTNARGGTAVGEGLELALDAFDPEVQAQKVILLLTDGEDHTSDPPPTEIAYNARSQGIPIHVVAYGTPDGARIYYTDETGQRRPVVDDQGEVVMSTPDEGLLERIAGTSRGAFLAADRTAFPLDEIWNKRISQMEGVTRASSTREEGIDRFQWAVVLALVCLGVHVCLSDGRMQP